MIYLAYILTILGGLASGTYLVVTEHYGWAWIPFLLVAFTDVRSVRKE